MSRRHLASSLLRRLHPPPHPPPHRPALHRLLHPVSRPALRHLSVPPQGTAQATSPSPAPAPNAEPNDPDAWVHSLAISIPGHSSSIDPFHLVSPDLDIMTRSIRDTISVLQHPRLNVAASHLLSLKGKRIRPIIVLLMAHATAPLSGVHAPTTSSTLLPSQLRLAEITELIHAASLLHDDVIDAADLRRGVHSVNSAFGNQLAVLAGDFLLARASVALARLRDCDVVELLSTVIEHLVRGEVIQMNGGSPRLHGGIGDASARAQEDDWFHRPTGVFETYLAKTFFKTASLVANSCRAVAMLGGHGEEVAEVAYRFGEDIGMAFQLVDDLLDVSGSAMTLGKPVLSDVRQGLATAPVLFAMRRFPEVEAMVERRFGWDGDVERVVELVERADGVEQTRELAREHVRRGVAAVAEMLPASEHRSALINVADFVLRRQR